jgi:hypothetical protein
MSNLANRGYHYRYNGNRVNYNSGNGNNISNQTGNDVYQNYEGNAKGKE